MASDTQPTTAGVATWIVLVSAASVLFSLSFACAAPFAALATVSALALPRGPALLLVATAWLANQALGYGVLSYPVTPDSLGWGLAMGVSALAATAAVLAFRRLAPSTLVAWGAGFAIAFATYQVVLFAATALLPTGGDAFSLAVIGRVLAIDVVALVGLALAHRAALAVRLLPGRRAPRLARA